MGRVAPAGTGRACGEATVARLAPPSGPKREGIKQRGSRDSRWPAGTTPRAGSPAYQAGVVPGLVGPAPAQGRGAGGQHGGSHAQAQAVDAGSQARHIRAVDDRRSLGQGRGAVVSRSRGKSRRMAWEVGLAKYAWRKNVRMKGRLLCAASTRRPQAVREDTLTKADGLAEPHATRPSSGTSGISPSGTTSLPAVAATICAPPSRRGPARAARSRRASRRARPARSRFSSRSAGR